MSYILTALKKSEQERAGEPNARTRSSVPHALRSPISTPKTRPTWVLAALAGGGGVLTIAVAVWAAGPWSATTIDTAEETNEMVVTEALPAPAATASETGPAAAPIATSQATVEPSAGGRLPAQRAPRPVRDTPGTSAPLVALLLDPPASTAVQSKSTDASSNDSPIVPVNEIPLPPVVRDTSTSSNTDSSASVDPLRTRAKTVTVTPGLVEPEQRLEMAAIVPAQVDLSSLSEAADLHEQGWAFERSGDFSQAIGAFSRALDLRPDFADAYFGRAWIRDRLDQLDQATTDYGHAIQIDPKFAAAYGSRGVALFYLDQLSAAELDFDQALRLGRGELRRFAVLWRYLSAEHDGRDGAAQLADDTQSIKLDPWPGVIARYYLGAVDAEAILENARDADAAVTRERLCVAYFFIGQKHLLDGNATQARDNFQKALGTGVTEFVQYKAAQRELDRLARLR